MGDTHFDGGPTDEHMEDLQRSAGAARAEYEAIMLAAAAEEGHPGTSNHGGDDEDQQPWMITVEASPPEREDSSGHSVDGLPGSRADACRPGYAADGQGEEAAHSEEAINPEPLRTGMVAAEMAHLMSLVVEAVQRRPPEGMDPRIWAEGMQEMAQRFALPKIDAIRAELSRRIGLPKLLTTRFEAVAAALLISRHTSWRNTVPEPSCLTADDLATIDGLLGDNPFPLRAPEGCTQHGVRPHPGCGECARLRWRMERYENGQ